MSEVKPYRVTQTDKKFSVEDDLGGVILSCGDRGSAEHYAALLNQAFRNGYRNGFRDAKRGGAE